MERPCRRSVKDRISLSQTEKRSHTSIQYTREAETVVQKIEKIECGQTQPVNNYCCLRLLYVVVVFEKTRS